jgi:rod shape-determining protein MreC
LFDLLWRFRKILTVAVLFGLAVYLVVSQDKDEDEYNLLDHALVKVTAPLQWFFDKVADSSVDGWSHYVRNRNAAEENDRLRDEMFQLARKLKATDEVRRENHRLLALLGVIDRSKDVRYLPANVVGHSTSRQWKSLRIDRGVKDGVERGMGVIAALGLVGRVMAVEQRYSDVMLLSDTASSVDVIVGRSRARGRLRGLGDAASLNARIDYLTRSAPVEVGDEVVTSGAGVVFPKGVVVGYVRSVNRVEHGLYQEVLIEPAASLAALDEVLVVQGFGPEGAVQPLKTDPVPDYFEEDVDLAASLPANVEPEAPRLGPVSE